MKGQNSIDNIVKQLTILKSQINMTDSELTPEQDQELQKIRQKLGMSTFLTEKLSKYNSLTSRYERAISSPRSHNSDDIESRQNNLIQKVDEFFIALSMRDQEKSDAYMEELTELDEECDSKNDVFKNIVYEGCTLYWRIFS
jgi:ribosomal protein L16 Arg81 hydroxylase